jgi:outer membrane protein
MEGLRIRVATLVICGAFSGGLAMVAAQTPGAGALLPGNLTLVQAKDYALRQHPRIRSAVASAQAAQSVVKEVRSAELPTLSGEVTGIEAQHSTVLAAGAIQTSSLYTRFASGIALSQLVTDFGQTRDLTQSAGLRARSESSTADAVRQQVLFQVEEAYFQALSASSVLDAARAAVNTRDVTLRQILALAESAMRSTLDVRFAEVALSQAQLDLEQAENAAAAAQANLSEALGLDSAVTFHLNDEPLAGALDATPDARIQEALSKRPELAALNLDREAAHRYAQAEGKLKLPTVSLLGVAGGIPAGDPRLPDTYAAAGVNINIPILNGGLFSARREEAEQRAVKVDNDARDLAIRVARDVRVAWLEATTAARRMDVTATLVAQANEALRLAQTRYDAGLGSIVELSQAQLNQTSAQIQNASARYEYQSRRAALDYATGILQ